jgi:hypothetical protein
VVDADDIVDEMTGIAANMRGVGESRHFTESEESNSTIRLVLSIEIFPPSRGSEKENGIQSG